MLPFPKLPETGARTARLEQRVSPEIKELIERASHLQGVNASEFLIAHSALAARETISRFEATVLRAEDRAAFMTAFTDTEPNDELVQLIALHKRVAARR